MGTVLASEADWETIWEEQLNYQREAENPLTDDDLADIFAQFDQLEKNARTVEEWIDGMSQMAMHPKVDLPETERLNMIRNSLGNAVSGWTPKIKIVVTEVETNQRRVFDENSDVPLVKAIAASGAFQGAYPTIQLHDKHYYDGGSYSMDNPDVSEADKVVVLAANLPVKTPYALSDLVDHMQERGQSVYTVKPDSIIMSILEKYDYNTMNGALRKEVAEAARQQGHEEAQALKAFWNKQ
ncbi:patatin-like phospholipase family protein [Staphylococcus simulans]|uniref:patatin-like phospholipase family protein n=1 Tax=Staphylococcus simulans TaxID=1286 RepID=UPI0027FCFA39|nr:patatin-like phospholipase family protein [Staphylococcus simulans]MDQ7113058.1 patatin-like phospholipase family protein [Staphylococcus simulans]MDQ7118515.1 patatin-like phospholipase family protein [Staphylococcus simulans]